MKLSQSIFLTALLALGAAGAVYALQQPSKELQEMFAKMTAFGTPGENHKLLDFKVGKWNGHVTMWMVPGAPPMESEATSETKWIMGGRYLHDDVKGTFGGQPFEGLGISGYDNLQKKFVYTWVDNTGTGIMSGVGTYDAAKKVLTTTSTMSDPVSGKVVNSRGTETKIDNDTWKMEMYATGPDGKEFLTMRIDYKRAK